MGSTPLLLAALAAPAVCVAPPAQPTREAPAAAVSSLEDTYRQGVTFQDFLHDANRRKDLWTSHYENGRVEPEARARARALQGTWRILAIAEDWCSDSVNTIPFLALLADIAPAIEMRVIDSEVGQEIMEAHLTPDGRPATPTVLVLDQAYQEVGCWVERPGELQVWALENRESLGDEFMPRKMAWYRDDAGRSTIDEVLTVIEAAANGRPLCRRG